MRVALRPRTMLTRLIIRNFKRFAEVEIELGDTVVFVGPNNAGKTSALQALALWELGLRRWTEKRGAGDIPAKRPGVTLNRRDFVSLPVPETNLLWRELHVMDSKRVGGKTQGTEKIRIEIIVEGITAGASWSCGLEFDYANDESVYCRPLRLDAEGNERMPIPAAASRVRTAFLPPMSGLAATELRIDPGAVQVRIGEGRTAEVLRNLCLAVSDDEIQWAALSRAIRELFGVDLDPPRYIKERGEITMTYTERGTRLDLSASGRGLQQTLLLLAYMRANPGAVLMLDEPDAHLEILRQRQIYQRLTAEAQASGSQILAASHSEVVLDEAADRDVVVAFVGTPHRIDDRGKGQVLKSIKEIGFDQYYQAEIRGWVLYLEGSTDLAILRAFARVIEHPAAAVLESPFVKYVQNLPNQARHHFHGLREGKPDLVGVAIFDRIDSALQDTEALREASWTRREIESYLCQPETVLAWAEAQATARSAGTLFESVERDHLREIMKRIYERRVPPIALADRSDRWWQTVKATDDLLDPVFADFYEECGLPNVMRKTDYHRLAEHVPAELLDPEIADKLGLIAATAGRATPAQTE